MKKTLVIGIDLLIMSLILFFIIQYANTKMRESNDSVLEAFQKTTVSAEQIVTNYLEDEQHLCDIWSNYINRSAEEGEPMTAEQAIAYIRKVKISSVIYGHLIFPENLNESGISTHPSLTDPEDYSVSYRKISLFDNPEAISSKDGDINLTRAYTNPQNGVQSIAFMNYVTILDETTGQLRKALLMRVEPVSVLEEKLDFLNGEYESVEISLINKEGEYLVHGRSLKNSNFFEYYKSYNAVNNADYNDMIHRVTTTSGTMTMLNSKKEECVISYTPLKSMESWFLLAYIPAGELATNTVVDWLLLGMVTLGLLILLTFNVLIMMFYNRKLAEAAEAAKQANEAKSHFLSTMSHDIRTPMNAILGLDEMILRNSDDEEILAWSESIRTAGKTLLGIINDILDFSKIEAGKMDIIPVDYSFVSMLNDLVNMVQGKAESKGIAFYLDVDRSIPTFLHGDEIRIKQIITNMLSNAVKYTKEGSITLSVAYEKLQEKPDAIRLLIRVRDTGIGIKPEDMDKLFSAFERIEEERNHNIEGTGLGMSIAQRFLAMMGSHMEVQSQYGKGSIFSFALQQEVKDWNPIGDYEETFRRSLAERKTYREQFTAPHVHVLVVDDTPVNLTVFRSLLKRTKVQIDTAGSGDEAIALFKQKHYDVIFLDHMMPVKDGIETLQEMKQLRETTDTGTSGNTTGTGLPNLHTPVICLTANAISGMREMYIEAGFDDYLTKPIDPERLEAMLLQYIPKGKIAPASDDNEEEDSQIPDFLFKIEELDVNSGLIHCGSSEAYHMALQMFLDAGAGNIKEIRQYWKVKDLKNITIKVHALKSTARVIGALRLGDFAARLEKAGDGEDIPTLEAELEKLLSQYEQLLQDLEPLREEDAEGAETDKPLITDAERKEAYTAIAEFCASFDYDSVVNIVESLKGYRFPEEEATRFDALRKAVDNFDYDLIPEILSEGEK